MKILFQNSVTMKIFWMCCWLFSIAFAKPISEVALRSALEGMDPTQLAIVQRNVEALSAMAAKVMPTVYGDGGKQSRVSSPPEDANDEGEDEKDYSYDLQNFRAADDTDYQDHEFEDIYNTMSDDYGNAKEDDEEEKGSSADASKANDEKKPSSDASKDNNKKKTASDASKKSEKKATEPKGQADEKEMKNKP